MMDRKDVAEIAYRNGYNNGIRTLLQAQKTVQLILSALVAISLILSVYTAVELRKLSVEVNATVEDMAADVRVISDEFKNLAYRIDRLEQSR